ncbi:MAG: 5'-nucleotidase SurE [Desulfotomaculum sp. 46_296]|nr:MAG: 5'-nucleotidase SurE [Desulfotomaculum sp. 46_296]
MRILVVNDDGIYARGLSALVRGLKDLGEIYVVAPDRERSATGHSITVYRPLRVKKVSMSDFGVAASWAVDGTPSDCVKLAVEDLLPNPPDIILSGINQGPNLGTDVLYSGTVSAAIEGFISGFPAIAVSLASFTDRDFSRAGDFTHTLVTTLEKVDFPQNFLLNVNVPVGGEQKGVKITRLGNRRYINIFEKRTDPRGRIYYWMAGDLLDKEENSEGTDVSAVKNNYISITPLHLDLSDYSTIDNLKNNGFLENFKTINTGGSKI